MKMKVLFSSLLCAMMVFSPNHVLSKPQDNSVQTNTQGNTLIAVGAGVKVRAEPNANAKEVTRLQIGAVADMLEKSAQMDTQGKNRDYWYKITSPDGKQGWVFGSFVTMVDKKNLAPKYIEIASNQLAINPPVFTDLVDVVNFLKRVTQETLPTDAIGELQLLQLQLVERALNAIPADKAKQPPYQTWINEQGDTLIYHEMAGTWIMSPLVFWKFADQYVNTPVGDKIAWAAANIIPGGECELDMSCNLHLVMDTYGKYLSLYPNGKYQKEALKKVSDGAKNLKTLSKEQGAPLTKEQKAEFTELLGKLKAQLKAVNSPDKNNLLQQLDKIL